MDPSAPRDQFIPQLIVHDGTRALDFYASAFGAVVDSRTMTQDGKKLVHGEMELEGHKFYVSDEFEASEGGTCVRITLLVDDADKLVQRAKAAGATVLMPVQDMFWGARYGKIVDPFGHEWGISQATKKQSEKETQVAADKFFAKRP